jgi:hypothetical protein
MGEMVMVGAISEATTEGGIEEYYEPGEATDE